MPEITEFTRPNAREVGVAIEEALKPLAAQFGLTINYKGYSFSSLDARFTLEAFCQKGGASKEEVLFHKHRADLGLEEADLGRAFSLERRLYTFKGVYRGRHGFEALGETERGATYRLPLDTVKAALRA